MKIEELEWLAQEHNKRQIVKFIEQTKKLGITPYVLEQFNGVTAAIKAPEVIFDILLSLTCLNVKYSVKEEHFTTIINCEEILEYVCFEKLEPASL